jgi:DNA modification methylase
VTSTIYCGDCRDILDLCIADNSVQTCVTSPPYFGLRDYGVDGQIGLEKTPAEYVEQMVAVFREVRRVLRDDATLWLNLGDSYASPTKGSGGSDPSTSPKQAWKGSDNGQGFDTRRFDLQAAGLKTKDLIGIPWRVAFALQADGWYLRQDIIWHKPNPMPESVRDRCTKAHEYLFLLSKSPRYHFDAEAIAEDAIHAGKVVTLGEKSLSRGQATGANVAASGNGKADSVVVKDTRNKRSVWTVTTRGFKGAHFATFPPTLIEPCILAGSKPGDLVLDPFAGSGTTGVVSLQHGRSFLGIELNPAYVEMARKRIAESLR